MLGKNGAGEARKSRVRKKEASFIGVGDNLGKQGKTRNLPVLPGTRLQMKPDVDIPCEGMSKSGFIPALRRCAIYSAIGKTKGRRKKKKNIHARS